MALFGHGLDGCTVFTANSDAFHGTFTVQETATVFTGHYPGRPILPGAYLIEAGLQAIEMAVASDPAAPLQLLDIERFRLFQPVLPGRPVTLHASRLPGPYTSGKSSWKHEVFLGDRLAARFRLTVGTALTEPLDTCEAAEPGPGGVNLSASDILGRLPHRWPILLIDRANMLPDDGGIVTTKAISLGDPCYADFDGPGQRSVLAYPTSLILESFTQSVALLMTERLHRPLPVTGLMVFGGALAVHLHHHVMPGEVISNRVIDLCRYDHYTLANGLTLVGNTRVATFEGLSVALIN